ncbi:hypothetical protein LCGC14_2607410 [marine sediment metagenome]|uniref:Uncharacterized protein n=1 Tax=marine sediment metagenome TaxID=412755 RepID=A0A0F9A764_9ZZZZ
MSSRQTLVKTLRILAVAVLTAALSAVPAHAGDYYWDAGGGIDTS